MQCSGKPPDKSKHQELGKTATFFSKKSVNFIKPVFETLLDTEYKPWWMNA